MAGRRWRPRDEAEACTNLAAFVEWQRATTGQEQLAPEDVRALLAAGDPGMLAAAVRFCGGGASAANAVRVLLGDVRPDDQSASACWPRAGDAG